MKSDRSSIVVAIISKSLAYYVSYEPRKISFFMSLPRVLIQIYAGTVALCKKVTCIKIFLITILRRPRILLSKNKITS